jgi:serine/threonine protein kinase
MAPERFKTGEAAPSSDVYALACVFYQCLTGHPPFPGEALEQIAVGHMVAPPPRPSEERDTVPTAMDLVIARVWPNNPPTAIRARWRWPPPHAVPSPSPRVGSTPPERRNRLR